MLIARPDHNLHWLVAPIDFGRAISVADMSMPDADEPAVDRRRVAAHVSGHVVVGLLNNITIDRVTLRQQAGGVWVGQVAWAHPILTRPSASLPRRIRRRAHHQLLNSYLGGRAAELMDGYGYGEDGVCLDFTAPDTKKIIALAELMAPHDPWRVIRGGLNFIGDFLRDPVVAKSICRLAEVISVERDMAGAHATWYVAGAMRAY